MIEYHDRPGNVRQLRDVVKRAAALRALAFVNGNIVKAADLLGISWSTLYDLMNRLAIRADR